MSEKSAAGYGAFGWVRRARVTDVAQLRGVSFFLLVSRTAYSLSHRCPGNGLNAHHQINLGNSEINKVRGFFLPIIDVFCVCPVQ